MKIRGLLLAGRMIIVFFFFAHHVSAQGGVNATATAEVLEALKTQEMAQLNFGRFTPTAQGGKIILTPEGDLSTEGTVALDGGAHNPAIFYITGQSEVTFSIKLPLEPAVLTNPKNDKTIMVSEWKSSIVPAISAGKLKGGGMIVRIGASLTIGDEGANPVGIYAGSYAVTFTYD